MKLTVTEYVPKKLRRMNRLIQIACIVLTAAAVVIFCVRLGSLREERQELEREENRFREYGTLLEAGDSCMAQGDYAAAEESFRRAVGLLTQAGEAYWKLAALYEEQRKYEQAIFILELCPAPRGDEQNEKLRKLRELTEQLSQSVFVAD